MSKASDRREARRANRRENQAAKRAAKAERQKGRQGFLSGIIDKATEEDGIFDRLNVGGGGGDFKSGEEGDGDNTMMYAIGAAALVGVYLMMKK